MESPAVDRKCAPSQATEGFPGLVGTSHERPLATEAKPILWQTAPAIEGLGRDVGGHRVVSGAGLQVLADGDHLAIHVTQVFQGLGDLGLGLPQASMMPIWWEWRAPDAVSVAAGSGTGGTSAWGGRRDRGVPRFPHCG